MLILSNLPRFRGNIRSNEKHLTNISPEVNVRTFLRALETHFLTHDITDNDTRVRILFAQIDKTVGDAFDLVTCYAGRQVTFDAISRDFLTMYPEYKNSNFRHAACSMTSLKLEASNIFWSPTRLETKSRAVVEAYLSNDNIANVEIFEETLLETQGEEITVQSLLQNFLMHLVLASQSKAKIYKKLTSCTPIVSSTAFMAKAVALKEKEKLLKLESKLLNEDNKSTNDILYKIHARSEKNQEDIPSEKCYRCGQIGHIKKDCNASLANETNTCTYSRKKNHTAADCRKRIAKNIPFCNKCKAVDHDTRDCRLIKNNRNSDDN